MEQIQLNSGSFIPQIGLGTSKSADAAATVASGLQAGYRHVDTAQMYGNETEVGQGLRDSGIPRGEVFLTTKLHNPHHAPEDVHATFAESLQRLGVESVDLFLIHWPMPFLEIDYVDTWRAMIEIYESGRASSIGVSNFQPEHLDRIIEATSVVPAVNQIEVHPYFANNELRQYCRELGIAVEAWSPLGKGDEFGDPTITGIAERTGLTEAQVILNWHMQRGDVALPKSDNPERQRSNAEVFGPLLSQADLDAIDTLDRGEAGRRSPHPNEMGKS